MAVDNWTINLECDGAAEGERHVQMEMDSDEICYYNLIDLIKHYGYSSVDYLYYKRKDSLVVIEQDPEVMKMLNECESKRMGHHGGPGGTRTTAHQEVAHDKATSYKHRTPKQLSLMKVGSTVLLMTSKYPNNANVAYATLLSTNPEAIVCVVKTGSQFYKVHINHPIAKDEPLVRPMPRCNNIGDAQAKGVPIAWPSMGLLK